VIASGSSAIIPPIKGLDRTPYITNREIFYLDHLPKSLIVLGAGPIGIEMAQAFTRFGTAVAVVDMAPQILPKDDSDLTNEVMEILSVEGVKFYTSHTIEAVNDLGNEREVIVKDKAGKKGNTFSLKAEALLVALGRVANVEGLGLETIGIEHDRRGMMLTVDFNSRIPPVMKAALWSAMPFFAFPAKPTTPIYRGVPSPTHRWVISV
jgi:pyruvate/2-oxoglutarate dehydrogenase complex dihydrolipoamide dehydrogenase (E3) component